MAHAQALTAFCSALGIAEEEMKRREMPDRLEIANVVRVCDVRRLAPHTVCALARVFGPSLSVQIGVDDLRPLVDVEGGIDRTDWDQLAASLSGLSDGLDLQVRVRVEKERILEQMPLPPCNRRLYLFLDNLVKLLKAPLPRLDEVLFTDAYTPTLIVVCDSDVHCTGPLLTVASCAEGKLSAGACCAGVPELANQIAWLLELRSQTLNWVGFRLEHVTPLHLLCDSPGSSADPVRCALANRFLESLLAYTANRTEVNGQALRAVYSGSDRSVAMVASEVSLTPEVSDHLRALLRWLPGPGGADKLMMLQSVIAREVTTDDPAVAFANLVERFPRLLAEVRWHYRVFMDGKIDKHFEQVQVASSQITQAAKEIGQLIEAVTKGCVDTFLTSVGVIILTFVAAMLDEKTPGMVLRAGMWAYATYLVLFPLLYRMYDLRTAYALAVKEAESSLNVSRMALGPDRVKEMTGPLDKRCAHFGRMYWVTIILYVVVALAVYAGGAFLPKSLSEMRAAMPVPAADVTPTPTATARATSMMAATRVPSPTASCTFTPSSAPTPTTIR